MSQKVKCMKRRYQPLPDGVRPFSRFGESLKLRRDRRMVIGAHPGRKLVSLYARGAWNETKTAPTIIIARCAIPPCTKDWMPSFDLKRPEGEKGLFTFRET